MEEEFISENGCKKRTKRATNRVFIRPPVTLNIRPPMTEFIRPLCA
jgi:hypothetical protein